MTTTQLLLIIWVYIIGYTFSYFLWIRRWKQEMKNSLNNSIGFWDVILNCTHPLKIKNVDITESNWRVCITWRYDTIKLWKRIKNTMWLIQNRKYKQAREELKKVHKDILDPK